MWAPAANQPFPQRPDFTYTTPRSVFDHGPNFFMNANAPLKYSPTDLLPKLPFVTPTFDRSTVQTFYATLTGGSHLTPIGDAGDERAPAVAWLRLWVYGDQGARKYFDGADCILCVAPWTSPQRKNWP